MTVTTICTCIYLFIPILLVCYLHRAVKAIEVIATVLIHFALDGEEEESANNELGGKQ